MDGFAEVRRQLQAGQKIMAIKIYRELTGASLKDAKDAVEAMERGEMPAQVDAPRRPLKLDEDLRWLIQQNRMIDAVKRYREAHPQAGLKEAKEYVDRLAASSGVRRQTEGCARTAAVFALLIWLLARMI
ncbi:MAG: hypothetical protein FJX76_05025 [Armatimonadetes bacterium]|nr:hypothetical protein [Armatimonadota bacterium]